MNQEKRDRIFFYNQALEEFVENGGELYRYYNIKDISDNKWLPVTSFRAIKKLLDTGKLEYAEIGFSPTNRSRKVRGTEIIKYNSNQLYEADRKANVG